MVAHMSVPCVNLVFENLELFYFKKKLGIVKMP